MLPESVTITTSVAAATADTAVEVTAAATPAAAAVTTAAPAAVIVTLVTAAAVATVTRHTRVLIVVRMDRRTPTSPALSAAPKTARYSAACNKPCVTVSVTSFTRKQTASNWYNLQYYQVYVVIFNVMR